MNASQFLVMPCAAVTLLVLVLASCDSNSGNSGDGTNNNHTGNPAGTISGVAHLGPIFNGVVTVYAFDGAPGAILATGVTDYYGGYIIDLKVPDQPVLIKITSGQNSFYIEEASGTPVLVQTGQALLAVSNYTSGKPVTVNATYWTTLAAGLAEYKVKVGAPVAQAIADANTQISGMLGFDVVTTTPKDVTDINNKNASLTPELEYGFYNAAISKWTAYATDVNQASSHQMYSSIMFAQVAYDDLNYDGILDGKGSLGAMSFGTIPLTTTIYRHDIATYLLKMAHDGRNVTALGADKLVVTAQHLNDSTNAIFGIEPVIAIDGGGPNFTNVVPAENSAVYGTITASAAITDTLGLASVEFLVDNTLVGLANNVSAPSLIIDSKSFPDGAHLLAVRATNLAGTVKTQSVNITITNTQTTITNIKPAANSYQRGLALFKADVTDPTGIVKVQFYIDGMPRALANNPSAPTLLFDTTGLTDGSHSLGITTTNAVSYEYSVDAAFLTDNTAPVITAATPTDNSYQKDTIIATATATDSNLSGVQFFLNGNLLGSAIDKNAATYSINTGNYADGTHTLGVKALDLAGGSAIKTIPIVIDNTPPVIANVYPPPGTVVGNEQFNVGATISDISLIDVEFLLDGVYYSKGGLAVPSTFIVGSRLSKGSHIITIKATDATGHVSTASTSVVH